jgi:hypothetical protein
MRSVYTVVLLNRQFDQQHQQQAFYSTTPKKHERGWNIPANCKTRQRPSAISMLIANCLVADAVFAICLIVGAIR